MQDQYMSLSQIMPYVATVTITIFAYMFRGIIWDIGSIPFLILREMLQKALDVQTREQAEERANVLDDDLAERLDNTLNRRIAEVTRDSSKRIKQLKNLQEQQAVRDARHNSLRREVENLGITARQLMDGIGGMTWKTEEGIVRGIAFLSDNHLESLVNNGWVNNEQADMVRQEQQRRTTDDYWWKEKGKLSPRDTLASLERASRKDTLDLSATGDIKRWENPEADPLADIQKARREMLERTGFEDIGTVKDFRMKTGDGEVRNFGPGKVSIKRGALSPSEIELIKKAMRHGQSSGMFATTFRQQAELYKQPTNFIELDYAALELKMMQHALRGLARKKAPVGILPNYQPMPTTGRISGRVKIMTRDEATDQPDVPYLTERERRLNLDNGDGFKPLSLNERRQQCGHSRIQDDPESYRRILREQVKAKEERLLKQVIARAVRNYDVSMMYNLLMPGGFQQGGRINPTGRSIRDFTPYGRGAK